MCCVGPNQLARLCDGSRASVCTTAPSAYASRVQTNRQPTVTVLGNGNSTDPPADSKLDFQVVKWEWEICTWTNNHMQF